MMLFKQWLKEDAGETVGTYYNDELLQSRVKSKSLAKVNEPEMTSGHAERNFLRGGKRKTHAYRVNKDKLEEV